MTQAPTPGPLTSESVKLLVKGDWLLPMLSGAQPKQFDRVGSTVRDTPLLFFVDGGSCLASVANFIGRPDESGWMPWSGGENPVPGTMVERKERSGDLVWCACLSDDLRWSHSGWDTDIIAFRLAPTAPVEASGSEREEDALEALDWIEKVFPGQGDTNDQGVTVRGWQRLDQACATIRTALSRPQPSGETRELVARIIADHVAGGFDAALQDKQEWKDRSGLGYDCEPSDVNGPFKDDYLDAADAILALLSVRPPALGGQQGDA